MIRWAEISPRSDRLRMQALSEELEVAGCPNELTVIETDIGELMNVLHDARTRFSQIRLGGGFQEELLPLLEHLTSMQLTLGTADSLVPEHGRWWPRCAMYVSIPELIAKEIKTLDLSGDALVIGARPHSRAVVAALVKMGFQRFSLVDPHLERAEKLLAGFKRAYFNVTFTLTPQHLLTQLPGVHTLVVNCHPILEDPAILNELYYFNFIHTGGVVIETNPLPLRSPLLKEAVGVGARVITGARMVAWTDAIWARDHLGVEIDVRRLERRLEERLAQVKIDVRLPAPEQDERETDDDGT